MFVYVVILSHKNGVDAFAKFEHQNALKVAGAMMSETQSLVEMVNEIDGDEEGLKNLEIMKSHIATERIEDAIKIYNQLQYSFFTSDYEHHLMIKKMEVT